MQIKNEYPPNYAEILEVFPEVVNKPVVFAYGSIIYNPSGKEVPEDIIYHESIHEKQQGENPAGWWTKYLYDPQFRLEQEIEAYSAQYSFLKKHTTAKVYDSALEDIVDLLSSPLYNVGKNKHQIRKLIKERAKTL